MTSRLPFDLTTVMADALCAAADDRAVNLTRRDAARLADTLIAHLAVLGYAVTAVDHDTPVRD